MRKNIGTLVYENKNNVEKNKWKAKYENKTE